MREAELHLSRFLGGREVSLLSVKKKGGGGQRFWTQKDQQRWSLVVNEFDLMKDFTDSDTTEMCGFSHSK